MSGLVPGSNVGSHSPSRLDLGTTWAAGLGAGVHLLGPSDQNFSVRAPASRDLILGAGGSDRLIITSAGQILSGATALDADLTAVTGTLPGWTAVKTATTDHGVVNVASGANAAGAFFSGFKTRTAGTDANTIVANNDAVLSLSAYGADGAAYQPLARISMEVDGSPAAGDMPGRIVFLTTTDGTNTLTERVRISQSGEMTGTADLNFTGGYRFSIDDFFQDNVAANQVAVILTRLGSTGFPTKWIALRAGSITGVAVKTNDARTAGTLTVEPFKNGTGIGLTAVLDGTNTIFKATTQAKDTDTFVAGDEVDIRITTDAGWTPTTADIRAILEVET